MSKRLDPLTFPLRGSRLIEASAGTGKTFTLALLYTRLVLGHGPNGAAFERALMPPEILVVTFTDAATKELRDRIRARLVEAAACFEVDSSILCEGDLGVGAQDGATSDPLLSLRADYAPEQWPACARRLRLAAEWMDEAVIATIHGWCYRMLKEHAFDTRGLFQRELVTDQTDLIAEIVRDYWRVHFYPLPREQAACVLEVVASPDKLRTALATWLRRRDASLSYKGARLANDQLQRALADQCRWREQAREVEAACRALDEQNQRLEDDARRLWQTDRSAIEQTLQQLRPHLNGTQHDSSTPEKFEALLAACAAWSRGAAAPNKLKNFAQGAFRFKKTAKVQTEPRHAAFAAITAWMGAQADKPSRPEVPEPTLQACLLAHAADWVGRELERRLLVRAEMGFDDLLRELDAALAPSSTSAPEQAPEQAYTLATTIRRQFPVALIDEFQDTDPLQYRIFERIYASPSAADATDASTGSGAADDRALILIGDPKQSIYGFRGADIHAYLAARAATAGRHYSLGTNYRGTTDVVAACNRLFRYAETHPRAAFRFQTETGNPIPFLDVNAQGRKERLILDGAPATAMTFWTLNTGPDPVGSGDYRARMAASAATAIAGWLRQAPMGQAGFQRDDGFEPLRPRDIAILVRTGTEAAMMREALAARRIASVYLSDRDSVLDTQEAIDLLHWLRACASPTDEVLVRAALGSNTMAMPLDELERLQHEELGWEARIERFRGYRQIWRHQGVLAMVRQLLNDAELPARLLARTDGERILTNLLHLAEWLQQSATAIDGEQALIRHLSEHVRGQASGRDAGDEFIVRLESDAELVQVITIHKSKGLEYPLVLLPFICGWRAVDGKTKQVPYRQADQRLIELAGIEVFRQAWNDADDARLSEDMRLLYVAVTRARHAVWLGIAALKSGPAKRPRLERSAIGHVLNGGLPFEGPAQVWDALEQLRGDCAQMRIAPAPSPDLAADLAGEIEPGEIPPSPEQDGLLDDARAAPRTRPLPWWIASYSSLRLANVAGPAPTEALVAASPAQVRSAAMSADTAAQETALEEAARSIDRDPEETAAAQPRPRTHKDKHLHALPRGSRLGTFLHGILEWAAVQRAQTDDGAPLRGFAAAAASPQPRREMLGRRCNLRGLTGWIEPLNAWLGDFLTRRWTLYGLPDARGQAPTLALCDLPPRQVQVEMEFWLESRRADTAAIDALVQSQVLIGQRRPGLETMPLNGMLKGFIDLVFEHDGRYYVLDWKSNWLGADDAAYTAEAMRAAMLHARYDLQYVLYLLALHRQLQARLPGYDYDRHIGGALYAFLRGSYSDSQGLYMDKPPRALIEKLDRLFAGETTEERTA